ncbi:hypothetical protein D3C78_1820630 [compost metagenome]
MLEDLDLLGQRRLRHAQAPGGATEALLFGDGEKQPEVPNEAKVDHRLSIGCEYESLT